MAVRKLARGTRVHPERLGLVIEGEVKDLFHAMAQDAGVSDAVFFESVVRNLHETLTDRGLPTWWPAPTANDGELDIDAA